MGYKLSDIKPRGNLLIAKKFIDNSVILMKIILY